ncbi:hypothetical protein HanPSC8_Chr01g0033121 [Helianthus annuus]|nr:hypothetical protein HanPSC8_Chr01g0033121 [Helianthus annuus]
MFLSIPFSIRLAVPADSLLVETFATFLLLGRNFPCRLGGSFGFLDRETEVARLDCELLVGNGSERSKQGSYTTDECPHSKQLTVLDICPPNI